MLKQELQNLSENCYEGCPLPVEHMEVEKNSLDHITGYVREKGFHNIVIIEDTNTKKAAGDKMEQLFSDANTALETVLAPENEHGQVTADERTIMQMFVQIPEHTDCLLAVGSGTIHDITRFVSAKMKIPFISVPTAASVDGFTSKGAPLILGGVKQTVQAAAPLAVFADVNVLRGAPQEMAAAGFGDMAAKSTSVFDWEISRLIAEETYNEWASRAMQRAWSTCRNEAERIAQGEEEGLRILMESLLLSGLVMMTLDHSRPASGAEHHLSHYWELIFLKEGRKQKLHGAKVGVATSIISDLYKGYFTKPEELPVEEPVYKRRLEEHAETIKHWIGNMPSSSEIRELLRKVGGPELPEELGIHHELVQESLEQAHHLREHRYTGLKMLHMSGWGVPSYPFTKQET
ncbi:sn-glycerol-1-phosphate dehydrogenase [Salibacterium qingdaonense]|uniref:Glycerol-1-phosphate dehydrogenase [NAD(P)+] n=1 Tax=Salibacterium qingdaonense TaxID=266892 RepID=A0A1I4I1A4_9BACI|nr:sn-glycerol-1-phosphate dehydrogenase [Salibacterium qingdaonense]SFL48222.1 glycerol-1-phosphate dehydrogenase [NAD(P)+] [Salibacterium qingdaonense]